MTPGSAPARATTGARALALGLLALLSPTPAMPQASAPAPDPGVSLELARHRAATIRDIRYDLHLRVPAERDAPVHGTLDLHLHRTGDDPLVLDLAPPARASRLRVNGAAARFEAMNGHLVIPAEALGPGPNRLSIEFVAGDAPLNRSDEFLYTLFVPARAHEVFPSFDQPDLKARYRLTLTIPAGWEAVANGALLERREVGDHVVLRFAETEPLPSYLFAFAAGEFQVEEAVRDDRAMRMLHRETDRAAVERNRDEIFDLHATALAWLEAYTGIPYPFGKFDFVAVPSFQYNGMEHPGAILYRASSLFLDEGATRNQELGRASLIAHETAHMWFGDLVTMTWFDDVWMKEVFANFMAAKIVHPSFPDLDHDLRFLLAHHPPAYGVDRTDGANPIRQHLDNLDDAASLYGAIIYQKAPIVLRQLERLAGDDAFRQAVRRYLAAHAFGNAGWPDLVDLLDEAAPIDVHAWSRAWIEEPGRPTIRVVRRPDGVVLRQEDPAGLGRRWEQTLTVRARQGDEWVERPVRLRGDSIAVHLPETHPADGAGDGAGPAAVVLPNGDGGGYGLFLLDDVSRDALLLYLPELEDPIARASAWIDLHEMMLDGRVDPGALLDLAGRVLAVEENELVEQEVLRTLPALFWRWNANRTGIVAAALEALLWERLAAVEAPARKTAHFNALRAIATTSPTIRRLRAVWAGDAVIDGLPLSEQVLTDLALDLAVRGGPAADGILDAQAARIENPDRRRRFDVVRQAADTDPAVRDRFFHRLEDPENRRPEEWIVSALRYLHHPLRAAESVRYLPATLERLRDVRDTGDIFFPVRWLDASLAGHASPEAAHIVRAFIERNPDYPPRLMEKLLQTADPLFRAVNAAR